MKTTVSKISKSLVMGLGILALVSCQPSGKSEFKLEQSGDTLTLLHITNPTKYLLLPVEEHASEGQVCLLTGNPGDTDMDVRLAKKEVDYFVPFELPAGVKEAVVRIRKTPKEAVCWQKIQLSDTFDTSNRDKFRPIYHHTPLYGWMNDANGLVYKDGEYHLYFQYNPYGSVWGNMHWGHSVSRDLVHWEHLPAAIARDTMGHIFSGSSIVDKDNTAGYGVGNIVSFYTSASDKYGQIECMAYSKDNGRTFTKYEKNPVLTPFDGLKDFRDPKVFWFEPEKKWVMIVSADKEMRFYSSANLKDWTYMSAFGNGYGVQPSQFECPDMVQLPVDGDGNNKKWALIVNINPGCLFGGSATQYFIGDFDGTKFTCDTQPDVVKWMDWGKDHYATVCFSNTGERVIAMPWMSNWQYANIVPTQQFRSANALPRELTMYSEGKDIYLAVNPVKELEALRREAKEVPAFSVEKGKELRIDTLFADNDGAMEIDLDLSADAGRAGFKLQNGKGEYVDIYLDLKEKKLVMDRVHSGIVDFGKNSIPHEKEAHDNRVKNSINYVDDFALATWGPLSDTDKHTLRIFVDKCSVEIFLDGGKVAMTNLVFPNEPYNSLSFYSQDGALKINACKLYALGM
ncbi:DUF4980 domain-containing protein [Parabacteroides sp. AM08-6]|uniref:DUF4980 domain-containing protein n=1 Tax=Parabacteroides sp. AM08-6 TaxID=2292053 RepID=UPI000EFF2FF3|nr:DUF4980 domain-containing protein [Parabacteroides sp. AM08-6]RHJ82457.1 DUF4980 domain-containing protein [Parabacteroides sp. AM08-6]